MSKVYTYAEVQTHNTKEDLWMIYNGKVYDCTEFLDEHPGGEEVMIDCGGIDATGPFDDIGHSEEAREMLEPMYLGEVESIQPAKTTTSSAGASATTGCEQDGPLLFAVFVLIAALVAYVVFVK